MSALVHCIYTSVQTDPFSAAELAHLVKESRLRNEGNGITGILLHAGDTFFQVLEGPADSIEQLYAKILVDPRHKRVTRIIFEPIPRRYFEDSRMTLATISPHDLIEILQEKEPQRREHLLEGLDEGRAKRLLRAFTDGRWRTHIGTAPQSVIRA